MASATVTFAWGIVLGHKVLLFHFSWIPFFFFFLEKCQDNPPVFGHLFFFFFCNRGLGGRRFPNKQLHRFNLRAVVSTLSINADKWVFGDCLCTRRVSLTCRLAAWRCSRTPGSAGKTHWLRSAASRLLWGPDLGLRTPGCTDKQTQKRAEQTNNASRCQHATMAPTSHTIVICLLPATLARMHDLVTQQHVHVSGCYSWNCRLAGHL